MKDTINKNEEFVKPQWRDNLHVEFFHPFNLILYKKPQHEYDDIYEYGFSLDLTTEMYFYTYDWGRGFNLRILGFGCEIAKTKF